MGSGIEAVGNENSIIEISFCFISFRNFGKFVIHFSNDIEGDFDFFLGLICFHSGAHDSNVGVLLTNAMNIGDHHDVNVYVISNKYHSFS